MRRLKKLEIVWQRAATLKEIKADAKLPADMKKLVGYREAKQKLVSYRDFIDVDLPVGPGYNSEETVKRLVLRALSANMEPYYEYYYVVATLEREDGSELYRTIIPRTEIDARLRGLK